MNTRVSTKILYLLKAKSNLLNYTINKDETVSFHNIPTIAEVVTWLYEKHGIWIGVEPRNESKWKFNVYTKTVTTTNNIALAEHNSPTEAYSSAILYILNNLI